jgi:hypothetical protein
MSKQEKNTIAFVGDKYVNKYLKQILFALDSEKDDQDIKLVEDIINKIYSDGFEDGYNDKESEQEREDIKQGKISLID